MPTVTLPSIDQSETDINTLVRKLLNAYVQLTEEVTYLLSHLDTKNVNELNAEVLVANSITGDKIQAKSITAEKISVDELSAITARLGHIVSGLIESVSIYGSYIATSRNFPKVEISNTDNLLGAYMNPGNFIKMYSPVGELSPVLRFEAGGIPSYIFYDPRDNTFSFTSSSSNLVINTPGEVNIMGRRGVWINGKQVADPI